MFNIGCHLSVSKGYLHMAQTAVKLGGNTFQFFTRNPRGGKAKALDMDDVKALLAYMGEHKFAPVLAHAPYTLNPGSVEKDKTEFAHLVFSEDLARMEHLPGNLYNFHPGSYGASNLTTAMNQVVELLNQVLTPGLSTTVLLETMSGKGNEIGGVFEELRYIMDGVQLRDKLGVCLDTCHVLAAGYDIVNDLDGVLTSFDKILGLDKLKAVHLNDSMMPAGSHKDRHALLGEGVIGWEAIVRVINHPELKRLPFYLETPTDDEGHGHEMARLHKAYKG